MQTVFIDESGYTFGQWNSEQNLEAQPYYVLSAVCFPTDKLPDLYDHIRKSITDQEIPGVDGPSIGKGEEIKANEITRGTGFWKKNTDKRNAIRDIYLNSVLIFGGVSFVSIVDKKAHNDKYAMAEDPVVLALNYLYERIQRYLLEIEDKGQIVFDQNHTAESNVQNTVQLLSTKGSQIVYDSKAYGGIVAKRLRFNNIIDNFIGHSEGSVGLQIADFYASHTYAYIKDGKPENCGWWNTIASSLKSDSSGKIAGYGYKESP